MIQVMASSISFVLLLLNVLCVNHIQAGKKHGGSIIIIGGGYNQLMFNYNF